MRIYSWNPRTNILPGRLGRALRIGPRVRNFGDLLGPLIVERIRDLRSLGGHERRPDATLFTVGSVLHEAADDDVVWGSGMNGKKPDAAHRFGALDVRAVRGPRTAARLRGLGIEAPDVFGDPALLTPSLFPFVSVWAETKRQRIAFVPNLNELRRYRGFPELVSPIGEPWSVIRRIAQSESVIASSLHGLVIAEVLGIPAVMLASSVEPEFKYDDYLEGTGRSRADVHVAETLEAAMAISSEPADLGGWDAACLLDAFPADLWAHEGRASASSIDRR